MNEPLAKPEDQRFLKKYRLKLRNDFAKVFDTGIVASDPVLVLHALPNSLPYSRIGLSIPKKVGAAPVRNRWKRWMRESFRIHRTELPVGIDFVLRPRKNAVGSYAAIEKSMLRLMTQLATKIDTCR